MSKTFLVPSAPIGLSENILHFFQLISLIFNFIESCAVSASLSNDIQRIEQMEYEKSMADRFKQTKNKLDVILEDEYEN